MSFDEIERRFVAWAGRREDVRAALVVGSRARSERPADELSDLDIVLFARSPERLLDDQQWVQELGDVAITFVEPTPVGGILERRVLFTDGADVDFSVVPAEVLDDPDQLAGVAAETVGRGARVLVDTDGALRSLLSRVPPRRRPEPPSQDDLTELVNDFWYHAVWAARKLRRGEVFTAKGCVDGYLKRVILRDLAWHARAAGDTDTWHEGRFLEEWADPRALEQLRAAYGHYDRDDVRRALVATMELFSWLGPETAERHGLVYPAEAERHAVGLVEQLV